MEGRKEKIEVIKEEDYAVRKVLIIRAVYEASDEKGLKNGDEKPN